MFHLKEWTKKTCPIGFGEVLCKDYHLLTSNIDCFNLCLRPEESDDLKKKKNPLAYVFLEIASCKESLFHLEFADDPFYTDPPHSLSLHLN